MKVIEKLKAKANPKNARAIRILERRGLTFGGHYGYENAADVLRQMNQERRQKASGGGKR